MLKKEVNSMKNFVNWAILAPGSIANSMAGAICGMAKEDNRIRAYAVASRNFERAKEFSKKWAFEKAYGSYEELFNDEDVDVIYIANPHAFHFPSVMQALEAGKNVLCEKPAGCNMFELNQMIQKAESKNLFFMEAMWTAFNPCINRILDVIKKGLIGKVKHVESRFCNRIPYDPNHRLYAPELAGGALLDLGIYNIFFSMLASGTQNIKSRNSIVRMFKGVDIWNSVNLVFDNGVTASFQSAADMTAASNTHDGIIFGEKGFITVENFFMCQKAKVFAFKGDWGNENELIEEINEPFKINGYEYEMLEVTKCILEGKKESLIHPYESSRKLCRIMDELRTDWNMKYPFEI